MCYRRMQRRGRYLFLVKKFHVGQNLKGWNIIERENNNSSIMMPSKWILQATPMTVFYSNWK